MTTEELINQNNNSYQYIKLFCEEIPFKKINLKELTTYIPIDITKKISREIINNITPDISNYYDEYLKELNIEKGNPFNSITYKVNYNESILDIYVLIHEFYHYYISKICKYGLNGIPYILDEAKSIMIESFTRDSLHKIDLNKYKIEISNYEIDYFRYFRLFDERRIAGRAFLIHNLYLIDKNEDKTKEEIIEILSKKGENNIEYITYLENKDDKIFKYLGNKHIYLNEYEETHIHPLSYLISLDLESKENLKSILELFKKYKDLKLYNQKVVGEIKEDFNYSIIKNASIDTTKTEYIRKILKNEYNSIK